jgi:hypothetical protein
MSMKSKQKNSREKKIHTEEEDGWFGNLLFVDLYEQDPFCKQN